MEFNLFGRGKPKASTGPSSAALPQREGPAPRNGIRVLIVDDDPVFLRATSMRLDNAGFDTQTAEDCPQAIALLKDASFDAVVVDINFPPEAGSSWDGLQLLYWVRGAAQVRRTRFVVVTATDSLENRQRAADLGAPDFFPKPVDYEGLINVLTMATPPPPPASAR